MLADGGRIVRYPWNFLIVVFVLVAFGLVMVYSSSFIISGELYGNGHHVLYKQVLCFLLAILLCGVVSRTKVTFWLKYGIYIHAVCTVFLLLTFFPQISVAVKGARRWLDLGYFVFQPGELIKISTILAMVPFFEKFDQMEFKQKIFCSLTMFLTLAALIGQPDFGTFFIVFLVLSFVAFLSSFSRKYFYSFVVGGILVGIPLLLSRDYRVERIFSFLDPWKNPQTSGFQVIQSYLAFANGSIFGQGLGNSNEKLFYLPEAHNDFIFSVIGEELGLVGVTLVIAAFIFLLYYGFSIAMGLKDRSVYILCSSLVFTIVLQAVVNMGVVLGLLPTKGLNLPFISSGGSSLLINFFAVGLVMSSVRDQIERDKVGKSINNFGRRYEPG